MDIQMDKIVCRPYGSMVSCDEGRQHIRRTSRVGGQFYTVSLNQPEHAADRKIRIVLAVATHAGGTLVAWAGEVQSRRRRRSMVYRCV
jgi:hypothetical protein